MSDGRIEIEAELTAEQVHEQLREMKKEFSKLSKEMKLANMQAMLPFKKRLMEVKMGMFGLAKEMGNYTGTNKQFMGQVKQMGAEYKKANEDMMNANKMLGQSIIQTAGQMLNMSTQASKISANYDRMGNPLLKVNQLGLKAADGLNKLANAGNASVLALKMLGPNASMKELVDMQTMITQGMMRFQSVAIAAAAASVILYGALFKVAKGPDPSEVFRKQEEALAKYQEAVKERTSEILNTWGLFERAQSEKVSAGTLTANLRSQVETLTQWRSNLATIVSKVPQDMATELSQLGPAAAGQIAALATMSGPQLDNYVAMWKEKHRLAKEAALTELESLKLQTTAKVLELQNTLTPLGLAAEAFKSTWADALQPMVQAFTNVATPITEFATKIGELVVKFNEAHPTLALVIQGIIMLIPILTLLLSPLAIGIGLFAGFQAALAFIWPVIGPVITGLLSMSGTILIVAAAIVLLVVGIKNLWNTNEGFRNAVITAWNAIKAAASAIWNFILNSVIKPVMSAISKFVGDKVKELKKFWDENGKQITQIIQAFMNIASNRIKAGMAVIKGIFQAVWPIITGIIKIAWALIQTVISSSISVLTGIIKVGLALIKGDWKGAWDALKGILVDVWNNINAYLGGIDLAGIGRDIINGLIRGIKTAISGVKSAIEGMAGSIPGWARKILKIKSPSRVMRDQVGYWITEGIAKGIEANTNAEKAAKKKAMAIIKTFNNDLKDLKLDHKSGKLNSTQYIASLKLLQKANKDYKTGSKLIDVEISKEMDEFTKAESARLKKQAEDKKRITNEKAKIDESYLEKVKTLNDKYLAEEKRLTDEYNKAVTDRRKALFDFAGLFDEVTPKEVDGNQLIENLKGQVEAFKNWQSDLESLMSKGISESLYSTLEEMGPKAGAEIAALNTLTEDQLAEYVLLWTDKNKLATDQAIKELEPLKEETALKIAELREATATELLSYQKEWEDKTKAIKGIVKGEFGEMPSIGKYAINGLIKGLNDKKPELMKLATEIAEGLKSIIQSALQINSPSKWMRNFIGKNMMVGWQLGIEDEKQNTLSTAKDMTEWMMPAIPEIPIIPPINSNGYGSQTNSTNNIDNSKSFTVTTTANNTDVTRQTEKVLRKLAFQMG